MIRRPIARLAAALALLLLPAAARAAAVTGRVLDSAGSPVAGARVVWEAYRSDEETLVDATLGTEPAPIGETATDAEGRFRVTIDKPGVEVAIRVLPGALPGALLGGPYDAAEDVALGDVLLAAAEKVSGRVTDEAGKPVAGAKVRAYGGLPFEEEDVTLYADATTGADGSFTIANAPGRGRVTARAKGYSPATQTSFQERVTAAKLTLRSGATVQGTVLDPGGKPVEGAIVVSGTLAAKTDASGAYRISGVPTGSQAVEASWKDFAARKDSLRVKKGETAEVPLRLGRSASVTGTVVDEKTRRPIAGVRVSTASGGFAFRGVEPGRRARTDAKGKFRLVGLRSRAYAIRAAKTDYLPVTMPGVVAGVSAPGTVAIALQRSASIAGKVTDEAGAPVAGARVRIASDSGMRALMRGGPAAFLGRAGVLTGPDGTFRMRGLAAQKNRTLEAVKSSYATAKRHGVTLSAGQVVKDVVLVLKRGLEARGRVVDAAGQPLAGAEIRLSPAQRGGGFIVMGGMNREKPDATSGADGSFRVAGLEAGEYALAVAREGYAPKRVPSAPVLDPGPNQWPVIVLAAGVPIAGVVRNAKGEAIVGAEVFVFGEEAGGTRNSRTDPEGRFRLEGLSADRQLRMTVVADGYAPLQRSVKPSSEELVLVLKTAGTIRGRVEDAATKRPVTDFTASYTEGQGAFAAGMRFVMGGRQSDKAFQSSDGSFELADVPPGKWSVRATSPGYRPSEVSGIEVAEGETKEGVVVSLKKGGVVTGRVLDPRRGTGVPNASVDWLEGSDSLGQGRMAAMNACFGDGGGNAVTTDADGRFRFDGLPAGKLTFSAEHPDFLEASKQIELDDEATVELTLALGGSISGTVVAKDGRTAVPGAQVFLREQGSSFSMGDDSLRADAGGSFLFEHLKAGRYRVSARSNAGTTSWKDVVLGESQRQDGVLLEMASGATVLGTVTGRPGGRAGGVRIFASGKDYQDSAVTGDDGRFTLRDVPPGALRLQASTAFTSTRSTSKNLDVPEGAGEVPVEIVFEGASRLAGRVTQGEKPISGAYVGATPDPPSATGGRASDQTDEDGRYAIEGLSDGNYQVQVSGDGANYRRAFTVSGDTNGDIELPALTLSGFVTDAGSNEPLEGASIQAETGRERTGVPARYAATDSRGFYSFEGLDSGNYQITARKDGYQLKTLPVSVASAPAELNVSLTRGAGLTIRAVDGTTGLPLRSLTVLAYAGSGSLAYTGSVPLDAEGKGEVSSLSPGGYALYVFSQGFASRSYPVTVPSPMLSIAMTPGGRVEVRTDVPFTGRLVDAAGAPYLLFPGRMDARVSGAPPVVSWGGLAPGSYRLIVSGPSGENAYPFTVSEGATATVQIR
ncbi:MAG: carboxypeptidase regulatory-like domain-containing protein [Acidobacteriota bacterium]|nr:carboxypeptidase regulatory-like domain-containing protein [Acidobacteriota bacterium]